MHFLYLSAFLFFLPAYSLHILLPLYVYPTNGAWSGIWKTVSAHPKVQFQIIVNPNSGPGSTTYPDTSYTTALARLNKYPNVQTIGYVPTNYTHRALDAVVRDIDTYAGWAKYATANVSVSGIFFDEVTDSDAGGPKAYMRSISNHTYSTNFSSSKRPQIVFNPGVVIDASYFALADSIVEYEDTLADYHGLKTLSSFQEPFLNQTAVIINSAAGIADQRLKTLVQKAKTAGVGGIYLAGDCCYNIINGTLLGQLAAAVAAAA